jgi:hypothetical protein
MTYSCNTSPSAAFSPLSLPYTSFDNSQYLPVEGWNVPQHVPSYISTSSDGSNTYTEPFPSLDSQSVDGMAPNSAMEWNTFAMHGFGNTTPPTPETLPQPQQAELNVPSEESISFEALEEAEEEGEILVGMGLYDAPDKYDTDPQLDNYRSSMSQLLGTVYRPQESTGKGLKLEETWQPPESDDEGDDGEEDADGEEQDDETANDSD